VIEASVSDGVCQEAVRRGADPIVTGRGRAQGIHDMVAVISHRPTVPVPGLEYLKIAGKGTARRY